MSSVIVVTELYATSFSLYEGGAHEDQAERRSSEEAFDGKLPEYVASPEALAKICVEHTVSGLLFDTNDRVVGWANASGAWGWGSR